MLLFSMPASEPILVHQQASLISTINKPDKATRVVGVCSFSDQSGAALSPLSYPIYLEILKGLVNDDVWLSLNTSDMGFQLLGDSYLASLKVSTISYPKNGKLVSSDNKILVNSFGYIPNEGFKGKDRVGIVVEGRDKSGKIFSVEVRYYINVISSSEMDEITGANYSVYSQKYCHSSAEVWRISSTLGDSIRQLNPDAATPWRL